MNTVHDRRRFVFRRIINIVNNILPITIIDKAAPMAYRADYAMVEEAEALPASTGQEVCWQDSWGSLQTMG